MGTVHVSVHVYAHNSTHTAIKGCSFHMTKCQIRWQTGRQAGKQEGRQADRQADKSLGVYVCCRSLVYTVVIVTVSQEISRQSSPHLTAGTSRQLLLHCKNNPILKLCSKCVDRV